MVKINDFMHWNFQSRQQNSTMAGNPILKKYNIQYQIELISKLKTTNNKRDRSVISQTRF